MSKFNDYNFNEYTKKFIELNGFVEPTKIQAACIKEISKGKDVVAISNTGTGKTHAFLIPLMEIINPKLQEVQAVITAPTRELAMQIHERAKLMTKANPELKIKLITGGIEREKMANSIKTQPHIVIGTPGRIKDLFLNQDVLRVDTSKMLIVDEADMTLEFGFLEDIDAICSRMDEQLQMMCFSATIPEGLRPFLKKYMTNPQTIKIEDSSNMNPKIDHCLINCKHKSYVQTLLDIIPGFMPYVCLIFANTREMAEETAVALRSNGQSVIELHGGLEARKRKQAMKQLKSLDHSYIVCTDIAARGIDIEGITHVVSLGFPSELEFYIHRSGRTGRAGKEGTCFALYKESDDKAIRDLIEKGIVFSHRAFKNGEWSELKPYAFKRVAKNDLREKEIAKKLIRKNEKVKPGYKKKRAAEIQKIKRKERRAMIQSEINKLRKEKYKKMQREKNEAKL